MAELEARGITVRDVAPAEFIAAYALHLKNSDKFEVRPCHPCFFTNARRVALTAG
jgi:hypothetical protein